MLINKKHFLQVLLNFSRSFTFRTSFGYLLFFTFFGGSFLINCFGLPFSVSFVSFLTYHFLFVVLSFFVTFLLHYFHSIGIVLNTWITRLDLRCAMRWSPALPVIPTTRLIQELGAQQTSSFTPSGTWQDIYNSLSFINMLL